MLDVLEKAAQAVGSKQKLADLLKVSRPTLYAWERVPAEAAVQIDKLTKGAVPKHVMRPDLWCSKRCY